MSYRELGKKIIKILAFLSTTSALFLIVGLIYDDVNTQCRASKILQDSIIKYVSDKPVEYQPLKKFCTAETFCIINDFCPTGYAINYRDKPSECALADIDYFKGISASFGSCY